MRPTTKVKFTLMSALTSYEEHRGRVRWMEDIEALRQRKSVARVRATVARLIGLSPDQLAAIRKGRLKALYGETERKIDAAFVRFARRQIRDINYELLVATAAGRPVDPRLVAEAQAQIDALEQLIDQAAAAGVTVIDQERPSC